MNQSPLPPPSGPTCPNCGAACSASVAFCANCGAPLQAATSGSSAGKTLMSLALGCGALLFGALGGCLVLIGVMGGDFSGDWPFFAIGVAAVLVAAVLAWAIARAQRRK